jgi:hypothetical protein
MPRPRTAQFLSPLLILIGVLVTLENFQLIGTVSAHWPLLLIVLGLGFLMLFYQRQRSDAVLLWLGSFLTILALFCYYLNFTSWVRLARLWPIFLGIVGLSFLALGLDTRRRLYLYFAGSFIALFVILMLVFTVSTRLWPMSFVVFGVSLLVLEYSLNKAKP